MQHKNIVHCIINNRNHTTEPKTLHYNTKDCTLQHHPPDELRGDHDSYEPCSTKTPFTATTECHAEDDQGSEHRNTILKTAAENDAVDEKRKKRGQGVGGGGGGGRDQNGEKKLHRKQLDHKTALCQARAGTAPLSLSRQHHTQQALSAVSGFHALLSAFSGCLCTPVCIL